MWGQREAVGVEFEGDVGGGVGGVVRGWGQVAADVS